MCLFLNQYSSPSKSSRDKHHKDHRKDKDKSRSSTSNHNDKKRSRDDSRDSSSHRNSKKPRFVTFHIIRLSTVNIFLHFS